MNYNAFLSNLFILISRCYSNYPSPYGNINPIPESKSSDLPNIIVVYSNSLNYQSLYNKPYSSFIIKGLNVSENSSNRESILLRLDDLYNCKTFGVVSYCENSTLMYLIYLWSEERKIFFVSYSCTRYGPFAQIDNNVIQLDPGLQLYSDAITNNLEISEEYLHDSGIGIIIDIESPIALMILDILNMTLKRKFSKNIIAFTLSLPSSTNSTEIIYQLKRCQEYSVPLMIMLCDITLSIKVLQIAADFYAQNREYIINPFTTLMFTDIGHFPSDYLDYLYNLSKIASIEILYAQREYIQQPNSSVRNPGDDILKNIKEVLRILLQTQLKKGPCKSLSKNELKEFYSHMLYDDGSSLNGDVTIQKLSKRIKKLNINHTITEGIWLECRRWRMDKSNQYTHSLGECDLPNVADSKYTLKKHIRVLIEQHEFILWVNNHSSTDFEPLIHTVACRQFPLEKNDAKQWCSGLSIHLLEMIGQKLKIEFSYFYSKALTTDSIVVANQIIQRSNIQMLMFKMSMDLIENPYVDVTEPFTILDYAVMVNTKNKRPPFGAAFQPFTLSVWIMIGIIATVCAGAMALYEWNSPFGLNPWGRQRGINYSLASALTSVWAMLFGHTIHTKAPKSWPVKVLKNFWACACIVIVAMYTANLTVFIAGMLQTDICSIYKDGNMRVAVKYEHINISKQPPDKRCLNIAENSIITVSDDKTGQELFLNDTVQMLIGEKHELERFRYLHSLCQNEILPLRANYIGFSFGFGPGSPLFNQISQLLLEYENVGLTEVLGKTYIKSIPKCSLIGNENSARKGYGFTNMIGCFVFMGVGFFVSIMVLFLEHMLFRYIVPNWRSLPESSCLKGYTVMLISQRLYRVIHSERLIKPKETTREMIAIVRNREFHKMFFKENMHRPIPTRITSPTKISVYDISSEMVKMKRRSVESLAAIDVSNRCSFDDVDIGDKEIEPTITNNDLVKRAPIMSTDDEDITLMATSVKQESEESHSSVNNSIKYSRNKWRKKGFSLASRESSNSSHLSVESKNKYSKNPKLYPHGLCVMENENRRSKVLSRMQCLDDDDDDDDDDNYNCV